MRHRYYRAFIGLGTNHENSWNVLGNPGYGPSCVGTRRGDYQIFKASRSGETVSLVHARRQRSGDYDALWIHASIIGRLHRGLWWPAHYWSAVPMRCNSPTKRRQAGSSRISTRKSGGDRWVHDIEKTP